MNVNVNVYQAYATLSRCESADEIAEFLDDHGIKGHPQDPSSCPIAQYFREVGDVFDVTVDDAISVEYEDESGNIAYWGFDHTDATLQFVSRFDSGYYSNLAGFSDLDG